MDDGRSSQSIDPLGEPVDRIATAVEARLIPQESLRERVHAEELGHLSAWSQGYVDAALIELRKLPAFAGVLVSLEAGRQYTVELPSGVKRMLASGRATWDRSSDGLLKATIRDSENGHIVGQVKLKEAGLSPETLLALNAVAVQAALADIVYRLQEIDAKIEQVLDEIRHDRYGRIDAGLSLYRQALMIQDNVRREQVLLPALALLAEGQAQLLRSVRHELTRLKPPTTMDIVLKTTPGRDSPTDKFVKRFRAVSDDMAAAIVATRAMMLIYISLGETAAAQTVLGRMLSATQGHAELASTMREYVPSKAAAADDIWRIIDRANLPEITEDFNLPSKLDSRPVLLPGLYVLKDEAA